MTWKANLLLGLRSLLQSLFPLVVAVILALAAGITPGNIVTVTETPGGGTSINIGSAITNGELPILDQMVGVLLIAFWLVGPILFIFGVIEVFYSLGALVFGKTTYRKFPWDPRQIPLWCQK